MWNFGCLSVVLCISDFKFILVDLGFSKLIQKFDRSKK